MPDVAGDLRAYVDRLVELAEESVPAPAPEPAAVAERRPPRRRVTPVLVGAVAAAALVAAVVGVTIVSRSHPDEVATARAPAADVRVEGPSGSRWFVLDMPGMTAEYGFRQTATSSPATTLQAFRTHAGLDGPMVWVATDPLVPGALGLEPAEPGVIETTVGSTPAYLRQRGGVVSVSWPRTGDDATLVTGVGLPVEDVLAFAGGLRPRAGEGEGVDATVLPRGLAEKVTDEPLRYRSLAANWSYQGGDRHYGLMVETGREARFEVLLWGAAGGGQGVEVLSVDGRLGLISEHPDQGIAIAVWRPTDDAVAQLTTNGSREDLIDALRALRPVDEATWRGQFPDLQDTP